MPWSPLLSRSHSFTLFASSVDSVTTQTKALILLQETRLCPLWSNLKDSSESQMLPEAECVNKLIKHCKSCTIKPVFLKMALHLPFHNFIFVMHRVDLLRWVSLHCVQHVSTKARGHTCFPWGITQFTWPLEPVCQRKFILKASAGTARILSFTRLYLTYKKKKKPGWTRETDRLGKTYS